MYARVTMFKADAGARPKLEALTERLMPLFRAQQGFKAMYFMADEAGGEYAGFSLWDSKEAASAASAAVNPTVREGLVGIAQGPVSPRLFEVYEAKA